MLPGPLLQSPPPPLLELVVYPSVPSLSPSATPSWSIGSSIAIAVLVLITTAIVTVAIVVIRRSYYRCRRLSCSSFSPRCSLSPTPRASSSSSSTMSQMWHAAVVVVGGSPRASTASAKSLPDVAMVSSAPDSAGKAPPVTSVANSAEGSVKGATGYVTPSATPAAAMTPSEMKRLVPSAPSLPQVERVILELLSLPPALVIPGSSTTCSICNQVPLPTDVLLILPVCFHMFHQSCIVTWLRNRVTPSGCPLCHAPITIPCTGKKSFTPTFCPDEYDIESQMLVPAPPGEVVAEDVGGPRGWLRSSLDRFSRSWRGCSSNRATAAVVPGSSRRTTGSWSLGSSGHLGVDSHGIQKLPVPPEAAGDSHGWLRSSLATLSGSWTGFSNRRSTEMELPVSSLRTTGSLDLGPSGDRSIDIWSRSWDPEAAVQELQERPSVFNYARWLLRNSG